MKKYLLAFILLLLSVSVFTQTKPKPKEKPPTKKEMSDMMQEMQKSMTGMSPEDKKLLNGTGVKMPDIKSTKKTVSGISDGQIKKGVDEGSRIVAGVEARAGVNSGPSLTGNGALQGLDVR